MKKKLTPEEEWVAHRATLHEITCMKGHVSYSGDNYHHMSASFLGACGWGGCIAKYETIKCPPNCQKERRIDENRQYSISKKLAFLAKECGISEEEMLEMTSEQFAMLFTFTFRS